MYKSIPTYNTETGEWSYTDFPTRDEFKAFVWTKFKKPGEIKLRNTKYWRAEAERFDSQGYYCNSPDRSKDYMAYWNFEKEKCTRGVIIDEFYLTSYYYFWINFLKINDKVESRLKFPDIHDSQYYFFLYEQLCELEYKYSVVLKKRQWGSTFQHLAILINDIWFQEGYINKIGASDEEYLKADWSMLDEYRTFLNTNTAWYRNFNADKIFNWQQRWEVKKAGRKVYTGNSSIIKGVNFKISPTKGVGGKNNKFYYEEAGITKTMGKTFQYIDPALKMGALTTGIFMAAGSVGELDQCEDLKLMAFKPDSYNVLKVENDFEQSPDAKEICFFVPEYWSMPPFIDSEGNSDIEGAKAWCTEERRKIKENYGSEEYRMYVSQHPFNITEAFAWRKQSVFPQALLIRQQERIQLENITGQAVELDFAGEGVNSRLSDKRPIIKFPLGDKDDKTGCITVWDFPEKNPKWLTYFAGVDPIATGRTTTSPSLFSIYIFKNLVERTFTEYGQTKTKLEGYRMVASYTGRYDDMKVTNEIAEMLITWYNALAAVENNVPSFINHMQQVGKQRHLATKEQLSFVSELKTNRTVYSPWGFSTNQTIKTYFIDLVNEYIREELDFVTKKNSDEIVHKTYGVERILDLPLLEELKLYDDKLNTDRFIAFAAGLALMKAYRKYDVGIVKIDETEHREEDVKKIKMLNQSFFRHYGEIRYTAEDDQQPMKFQRKFFKNYK